MLQDRLELSERRACRVTGQHRSTQRRLPARGRGDDALRTELHAFSRGHSPWGYRRAWATLREEGRGVNRKRVQRLWREEGLRVPVKRRKRQRLGDSAVPAVRLRAERPNHVWALDFQFDQTADGRVLKLLNIVDEHTREALAIVAARSITADATAATLDRIVAGRGTAPTARRGVPVAYVPGLVMRRAADLYPGESKTDRRAAFVLADTGRTRRHQVHWLDAGDDELLDQLRVLNGYDADLAADATRLSNRLRDAPTGLSPALERVLGPKLHNAGARDLLARYPTPQALATAGRGRIARTLRKRSPRLAKALTEAVTGALGAQTVVVPGSVAMGRVIAEVATELERTQQRRERLGAEIGELFGAHPFGLILGSLPGDRAKDGGADARRDR